MYSFIESFLNKYCNVIVIPGNFLGGILFSPFSFRNLFPSNYANNKLLTIETIIINNSDTCKAALDPRQ